MRLLHSDGAQAGGIILVVVGLLVAGFFYVAYGAIMNQYQVTNNQIITDGLPYSQKHWDAMDLLFKSWWAIPIYFVLLFVIFAIKNALERDPNEV